MRWKFAVARWVSWLSNQLPVTSDQEIVQNPKSLQRIFWLRKRTKKKPMEPEAISLSLKHGVVSVYCLLFVVFSSKIATSSIWELCFTLLFLQCIKGNPKRVCFWCSSQFWGTTVYWLDTWPEWSKKFMFFFPGKNRDSYRYVTTWHTKLGCEKMQKKQFFVMCRDPYFMAYINSSNPSTSGWQIIPYLCKVGSTWTFWKNLNPLWHVSGWLGGPFKLFLVSPLSLQKWSNLKQAYVSIGFKRGGVGSTTR